MGFFKVYLAPFDDEGNYLPFEDITKYVNAGALGDIQVSLDGSEYQVGVFTFSNLNLRLNNVGGQFSDIDQSQSFFRFRRGDSKVKVTWQFTDKDECGVVDVDDAWLAEEIEIYKGLVSDESFATDLKTQQVSVTVLGFESIFAKTIVPFDTVSASDLVSTTIFNILNQAAITNLLTLDIANITPNIDQAIDSISSLQNKTVKEGLDTLLTCSNSVLYIVNDTIYVAPRTPSAAVEATFYGQASAAGAESIVDINDLRNGVSRVFNFITWKNATNSVTSAESVTRYGNKKKELDFTIFTNSTKINNILNSILDEFADAKQEFNVVVALNYSTLDLKLLDRVIIDYPTVYVNSETGLPICGIAEWGDFVLPAALWSLTIDDDAPYKIINKKINCKNQTITFRVRKI
jgi:hypothetical protein